MLSKSSNLPDREIDDEPRSARGSRWRERIKQDAEFCKTERARRQSSNTRDLADPVLTVSSIPLVEFILNAYGCDRANPSECVVALGRAIDLAERKAGAPSFPLESAIEFMVHFEQVRRGLGAEAPTLKVCRYLKRYFRSLYGTTKTDTLRKRAEKLLGNAQVMRIVEDRLSTMEPLRLDPGFRHVFLNIAGDECSYGNLPVVQGHLVKPRWSKLRSILSNSLRQLLGAARSVACLLSKESRWKGKRVSHRSTDVR
jgi:hypothetical protein